MPLLPAAPSSVPCPDPHSGPGIAPSGEPLIELHGVSLGYDRRRPVLTGVNLGLARGEYLGIVGPNGSGKTTLLRALLQLLRPLEGTISFAGGLRFGYVPQRDTVDALFPVPVEEIVLMGRYPRLGPLRRPRSEDRAVARRCLDHVGIGELARHNYPELSGGQRQRVLIARALATEPDVLVLDEPTHGMDMPSEHSLLGLVRHLHRDHGLAVVLVSHLLGSVADSAERIAILAEGRVEEGPRAEMLTAERLSRLYQIPVVVADVAGRCAIVPGGPA